MASHERLRGIFSAFVPSSTTETRSNGYRVLAQLFDNEPGRLAGPVKVLVEDAFRAANETDALAAVTFLTALFQTDNVSASSVLLDEGVFDSVLELLDLYSSPDISRSVASLWSQASAHKACREPLGARCLSWLQESAQKRTDPVLQAAAACALTKLFVGARQADASDPRVQQVEALISLLKAALVTVPASEEGAISDLVEAIAYITPEPAAKEAFARDIEILARIFSFVPKRGETPPTQPILYGIAVFVRNLAAYRPQRTAEEEQIAKLRSMTKEGAALTPEGRMKEQSLDERDDPPAVLSRCRRLLDAGAIAVLSNISRYARESPRVGRIVAETLLSFVEDKADRGKVLQGGGAKTLLAITRIAFAGATAGAAGDSPSRVLSTVDPADLLAAQALAKLAITSPPLAVFGPGDATALDAIRPLSALLLHPSATRLQTFEGLMALTNLASASPDMADRITTAPGVAGILETLLLDEHELVRRAAAELTCNILSGSPTACERVVSSPNRMTVLLALADVEDLATRSAVAGALACIAHDPRASRVIAEKSANVTSLVTSGDDGLAHRGVVVILGALEGLEEDKKASFARAMEGAGVVTALVAIAKRGARAGPLIGPTVEVLKAFNTLGISITA